MMRLPLTFLAIAAGIAAAAPAHADDANLWCGAAWACELAAQPMQPRKTAVRWAALAVSASSTKAGASHGQATQALAEQAALANCRRQGALDCQVRDWAENRCLGFALSTADEFYGYDAGASRAQAADAALIQCRKSGGKACYVEATPCAFDDPRISSPLPLPAAPVPAVAVDPATVGTWELTINPGRWIWRIVANGAYEFHSEAPDGTPPNAGIFTSSAGHWSIQATSGYSDGGSYVLQPPDTLVATGKLGTGNWHRVRQ